MEFPEISQTMDERDMEAKEDRIEVHGGPSGQGYNERIATRTDLLDQPVYRLSLLLYSVASVSIDPLFFYILIINDQKKCLEMDKKLKTTAVVLRTVFDFTYILQIEFQLFSANKAYAFESKGSLPKSDKVVHCNKGTIQWINWWIIIIDILCLLPIPQVVILVYFPKMKGSDWTIFFNFILLFQFMPKISRIYYSYKDVTKNLIPLKGLFYFQLYIIASHVMGSIWYFFSIHRELTCWYQACKGNSMCNQSTFFCEHRHDIVDDPIIGYLNQSCPLIPPSRFDFGMFTPALQYGIVNSKDFPRKFFYCFAWGLRNLSSFGSNLQTSTNFWESLFSAAITIIGLLLFIYLIGSLQTYLQFFANYSEKRRRKMEKKEVEIDEWIKSNEIPQDMEKELKDHVRQKMDENKDVNLQNLVNVLPIQSKKRITRHLCLHILKKVPRLQGMNDKQIDEIFIDHLKPVIFNKRSEIFKQGEPMVQMLFCTHGSTFVYSLDTITSRIERGNFYGEELLEWALRAPSSQATSSQAPSTQFPKSQNTVMTGTKVEAFALEAQDMKKIASSFTKLTLPNLPNVPKRGLGRFRCM